MTLKPYVGYCPASGTHEGADLIFAHTSREARKVGYAYTDLVDSYLDYAVRLMEGDDWLLEYADKNLLVTDTAHVCAPSHYPTCPRCERWGTPLLEDGICESCHEGGNYV